MLESRIVNGHPWSIGCEDPDPQKRGEDVTLISDLPEDVQRKVSDRIFGKLWVNHFFYVIPQPLTLRHSTLTVA